MTIFSATGVWWEKCITCTEYYLRRDWWLLLTIIIVDRVYLKNGVLRRELLLRVIFPQCEGMVEGY